MVRLKRTNVVTGAVDYTFCRESDIEKRREELKGKATLELMEEESNKRARTCPDCGRPMEYDGTWYCEYCEG